MRMRIVKALALIAMAAIGTLFLSVIWDLPFIAFKIGATVALVSLIVTLFLVATKPDKDLPL